MEKLNKAVSVLKKGGVIICPTDTVYGFLADATNKKAVEKIYKIKKRPKGKPLPVFVSGITMARQLAVVDARAAKQFKKHWPGAYTFVLKRKISNSTNSTAVEFVELHGVDKHTIALRVPKNAFLLKLLKKMGRPLVQTSVNLAGQEPLKTGEQILATFGKSRLVGLILTSGKPLKGKSSKVIDLTTQHLTRIR